MNDSSTVSTRLIRPDDAAALSRLEVENRDYLLSGGPIRSDAYVSVAGQAGLIDRLLADHAAGRCEPRVIEHHGVVVGRINLNAIVRGAFQSASVGYWVGAAAAGRGVASAALAGMVEHAFGALALHRLEAGTTLANEASAKVLTKAGFEQYGVARAYLFLGGQWRDHRMFQLLNPAWEPGRGPETT
jgi:ribosomal-protein-alanine N-acetyltransferase